jgi:N-glycosylase/DNA lyase
MSLIEEINNLRESSIRNLVEQRLREFEKFESKDKDLWFSELCFCLLTANSRAESAINIQIQIGAKGFLFSSKENIARIIKMNKHRFHNNKSKFITEARKFRNIKLCLEGKSENEKRDFLVENIKGLGMKESSHFLRNVGVKNLAILDRHILNLLFENAYILERPKNLTKKKYLEIENVFIRLAEKMKISPAELDLYMWYLKTGKVLK